MVPADWLVLTAANRVQAQGYQAQLRARQTDDRTAASPRLPQARNWCVIPDPMDRRVGSGGSTLWVLHQLAIQLAAQHPSARSLRELFTGQRILIIHSGGDSRRLCAYAAQGKVFTPLPCETHIGQPATLFDLILQSLCELPSPASGHVLIASGDVLLTLDPATIDFSQPGVTGVAYPGPMERGRQHGVYVTDPTQAERTQVVDFLQKPDEAQARSRGALDAVGRVLVDTGLLSLDPPSVERWLHMAGVSLRKGKVTRQAGLLNDVLKGDCAAIDLYEQLMMAMPPRLDRERYLSAVGKQADPSQLRRLTHIHDALHGSLFHVQVLPWCEFFHIGTSRELLANVNTLGRTAQQYRFANFHRAVVPDRAALEGAFIYNSVLGSEQIRAGKGVLLEAVHTKSRLACQGRNIVVGWPQTLQESLQLPEGLGVVLLPIQRKPLKARRSIVRYELWCMVVFGIDDDFKTPLSASGTFANRPLFELLSRANLKTSDLWLGAKESDHSLWTAGLWCCDTLDQVWSLTHWLIQAMHQHKLDTPITPPRGWLSGQRYSMAQIITMVDHDRLLSHRLTLQRLGDLHRLADRLQADNDLSSQSILEQLTTLDDALIALHQLDQWLRHDPDALQRARLFKLADEIRTHFPATTKRFTAAWFKGDLTRQAFASVAAAVQQHVHVHPTPQQSAILPDQVVWVTCPVRLDFHGGWSDTPPICTELGGSVLNAAITLNGQYPVQAIAKRCEEPVINLTSLDLGQRITLRDTAEILDHENPHDWAALPKAALVLAGICPREIKNARQSLRHNLEKIGGGLDITLFSALPKGSGLGTSSVLGAALLACLSRFVGQIFNSEDLMSRTSLLEQLMTTGGGWQDQVGGITPGVKLIRTRPGPDQTPTLSWISFDPQTQPQLRSRLLLYFTGQKRLARNILQNVVTRYLLRDPQAIAVVHELKRGAEQMKHDLDARQFDAFGRGLDHYWSLKKQFDPGSTNPALEKLLEPIHRYLTGKVLPGAGGGGFVFMMARDDAAAQKIRLQLEKHPPNPLARFFDFQIDSKGLGITVL